MPNDTAEDAIRAIEALAVSQGPRAGERVRLAEFQREFIRGLLAPGVDVGCLSVGRGGGKTALSAALAITHLAGHWGAQPQREIAIAARTRDQSAIAFNFARSFAERMPELAGNLTVRRHPVLELEFSADDGPHILKAMPSTGKAVLGGAATFAILDERAAWMQSRGAELEGAILTSLGKRSGRCAIISTSAPDDHNDFSRWLDDPPEGTFVREHRAPEGCAPDDVEAIRAANPGIADGFGPTEEWLLRAARQAAQRGGTALAQYRNLHLNQRVNTEPREMLIELDSWLAVEADTLAPREGAVYIGLDLGGPASMTAAAFFWPATGRLETRGWFPTQPLLAERGIRDGVGRRYLEMAERNELGTLGGKTVPPADWIGQVLAHVEGEQIGAVLADRFRQGEVADALDAAGNRAPVIWRGFGWRDGAEDITRFRRAVYDGNVTSLRSLLLRSALSDARCICDPGGNPKLIKGAAYGRIDAAAAAVLAVAEGARQRARPARQGRAPVWA